MNNSVIVTTHPGDPEPAKDKPVRLGLSPRWGVCRQKAMDGVCLWRPSPRWGVCRQKAMDGVCLRGLTLIEVVLAIGIMAMAAMAFFPAVDQGISFTKDIRDYSIFVNMGESLIHEYITRINHNPVAIPISIFEEDVTAAVKTRTGNPIFTILKNLKILATVRPSFLCENGGYEIFIRFDWESGGRSKSFSMFSIKAAPDMP